MGFRANARYREPGKLQSFPPTSWWSGGDSNRDAFGDVCKLGDAMYGCPRSRKMVLNRWSRDRVRSCIRPSGAACHDRWPVWRCADQAQNHRGELLSSMASYCISWSGSDRSFALTFPRPPHTPDVSLAAQPDPWIKESQPQELDNLPLLSAWPRLNGPSCWRGRSPQVCAVCARASDAARFLPAPSSGKPSAR